MISTDKILRGSALIFGMLAMQVRAMEHQWPSQQQPNNGGGSSQYSYQYPYGQIPQQQVLQQQQIYQQQPAVLSSPTTYVPTSVCQGYMKVQSIYCSHQRVSWECQDCFWRPRTGSKY